MADRYSVLICNQMQARVCTRCLIREMAGADSDKAMIEKYKDAIKLTDRTEETEYERRLAVCRECDRLFSGTCNACGCYVELRAAAKVSHCPKKKW